MFDYKNYFDTYCKENNLELNLSFNMPHGYETANGMFEVETKTVFINAKSLNDISDCEKLFYLFHELRHAVQYLYPDKFSRTIKQSLKYSIMYNGTCYKMIDGIYKMCKLEGDEEYFVNLYLAQPSELDANFFAYEQVKKIYGESEQLDNLYKFWTPRIPISEESFATIFALIDEKIKA